MGALTSLDRITGAKSAVITEAFLAELEEKLRHVRTQAGVRRFGLPIGSPIQSHTYHGSHTAPRKNDGISKPLHRLNEVFPDDVYDHPDRYHYENADGQTGRALRMARNNPNAMIRVYRSAPKGAKINHGDWVSLSFDYARRNNLHPDDPSKDLPVISEVVPAYMIYNNGDSLMEYGLHRPKKRTRATKDLLVELEEKVRHVRTPSGVRRFDLPIGSPIVAKPYVPHPRSRRERRRKAGDGSQLDRMVHSSATRHGGVTISTSGVVPKSGLAYAPFKDTETRIDADTFSVKDVADFRKKHAEELSKPGNHLGIWRDGDTFFLDISRVGPLDKQTISDAWDAQQLAVYDLGGNKEVTIGREDKDGRYHRDEKAGSNYPRREGSDGSGSVRRASVRDEGRGDQTERTEAPEVTRKRPAKGFRTRSDGRGTDSGTNHQGPAFDTSAPSTGARARKPRKTTGAPKWFSELPDKRKTEITKDSHWRNWLNGLDGESKISLRMKNGETIDGTYEGVKNRWSDDRKVGVRIEGRKTVKWLSPKDVDHAYLDNGPSMSDLVSELVTTVDPDEERLGSFVPGHRGEIRTPPRRSSQQSAESSSVREKFSKAKYAVSTRDGFKDVDGYVAGRFGIQKKDGGGWSVTHIPTGMALPFMPSDPRGLNANPRKVDTERFIHALDALAAAQDSNVFDATSNDDFVKASKKLPADQKIATLQQLAVALTDMGHRDDGAGPLIGNPSQVHYTSVEARKMFKDITGKGWTPDSYKEGLTKPEAGLNDKVKKTVRDRSPQTVAKAGQYLVADGKFKKRKDFTPEDQKVYDQRRREQDLAAVAYRAAKKEADRLFTNAARKHNSTDDRDFTSSEAALIAGYTRQMEELAPKINKDVDDGYGDEKVSGNWTPPVVVLQGTTRKSTDDGKWHNSPTGGTSTKKTDNGYAVVGRVTGARLYIVDVYINDPDSPDGKTKTLMETYPTKAEAQRAGDAALKKGLPEKVKPIVPEGSTLSDEERHLQSQANTNHPGTVITKDGEYRVGKTKIKLQKGDRVLRKGDRTDSTVSFTEYMVSHPDGSLDVVLTMKDSPILHYDADSMRAKNDRADRAKLSGAWYRYTAPDVPLASEAVEPEVGPSVPLKPSSVTKSAVKKLTKEINGSFDDWDIDAGGDYKGNLLADEIDDRIEELAEKYEEYKAVVENPDADAAYKLQARTAMNWQDEQITKLTKISEALDEIMSAPDDMSDDDLDTMVLEKLPRELVSGSSVFIPRTRRELFALTPQFQRDANGRSLPPDEYSTRLADLSIVGDQMLSDVEDHLHGNAEYRKKLSDADTAQQYKIHLFQMRSVKPVGVGEIDRSDSDTQAAFAIYDAAYKFLKDSGVDLGDSKPISEVEAFEDWVDTRNSLNAPLARLVNTRRREAARMRQDAILDYLGQLRPMGPRTGVQMPFGDTIHPEGGDRSKWVDDPSKVKVYDDAMDNAKRFYPTSWLAEAQKGSYSRAWVRNRAFHRSRASVGNAVGSVGNVIALDESSEFMDNSYDGGFPDYRAEVAVHELGHAMEQFVPGLTALEWTLLHKRAARPSGDWPGRANKLPNTSGEYAFNDEFKSKYAGRVYQSNATDVNPYREDSANKQHWELFTTGMQDLFGPPSGSDRKYAEDDEVSRVILAMLATLHDSADEARWMKELSKAPTKKK